MPRTFRFAEFELDLDAQQLRKGSATVRLERRPFDLLAMLVQRRAHLVTRDEIVAALWPDNVIIDFESGVNTLVRKVRNALGDSSDEPRFIETVPGRGYRFIAQFDEPVSAISTEPLPTRRGVRWPWLLGATLALVAVIAIATIAFRPSGIGMDGPIRIAIMPFENLTGDEELGRLAAGIEEDTNTSLAQIDLANLRVIGVVSARATSGSDLSPDAIGEQLGVDYIVTSSVRRDGSRIRVTSRLIRVADGEQLWSAPFDRELTNLLGLQRDLSVAIAEQVRQSLSPEVAAELDARQTSNRVAYGYYLKGRYEWTRFQPDSIPRALEWYRQAVDEDPDYALAWAGIAHALTTSVVTVEADPDNVIPAAREALQHALENGPDLAETQLALSTYHYFLRQDLDAAEVAARRAVELGRNSALSHMFLGLLLAEKGQYVEARAMLQKARNLDPRFPLIFANSALVELWANEPAAAYELGTQAVAINPEFWVGYLHRGTAQVALGDYDGALQSFAKAEKLSGNNSARAASSRAYVLSLLGRDEEVREILINLLETATHRKINSYYMAIVYAALDENDKALEWLNEGVVQNNLYCRDMEIDRMLDNLRSDLRLEKLIVNCKRALEHPPPESELSLIL